VPLSDGAGEVVARGADLPPVAGGDLVSPTYLPDWIDGPARESASRRRLGGPNDGLLAEYVVVHEEAAVKTPKHLDAVHAATVSIAGVTVWQALVVDAGLRPGDVVAVQGTGGVSLFVLQLALAAGARVVVLTRDAERVPRLERMGAVAIDTRATPDWTATLLDLTGGRGVDIFADVVGGDSLSRVIDATRVGGTVALVGFVGGATASLDLPAAFRRTVTLRAASAGHRSSYEGLVRAMEAAAIRPVVDRVVPFAEAKDGYRLLAEARPFGKIVVEL
jgi:NADPH:quinone reductase-like Zn-dependent oxidoreductase